jgi:hypothetical protein
MRKILFLLPLFALLFTACSGSSEVEIGNKTTMEIEPVYDAGKVLKGEKIDARFTIKNTGNYPLIIAEIKGSCTCTVADSPEDPIMPGDSYVVKAVVDTDRTGMGSISKGVSIVANTEPSITTVAVKATVLEKL